MPFGYLHCIQSCFVKQDSNALVLKYARSNYKTIQMDTHMHTTPKQTHKGHQVAWDKCKAIKKSRCTEATNSA